MVGGIYIHDQNIILTIIGALAGFLTNNKLVESDKSTQLNPIIQSKQEEVIIPESDLSDDMA